MKGYIKKSAIALRKVSLAVLCVAMLLSFFPVNVNAADYMGYVTVVNGKGGYVDNKKGYTSLKSLWNEVEKYSTSDYKITVDVNKNWNLKTDYTNKRLVVASNSYITLNMNGHNIDAGNVCLDRGLDKDDHGYGKGQIIKVEDNATLIINGGDTSTTHVGYLSYTRNKKYNTYGMFSLDDRVGSTKVTIHGALLTGGACDDHDGAGAITIGKSSKVTINNVTIAGNIASSGYNAAGGAINMYYSYSTLVLNGCTLEYNYSANEGGAIYVSDSENTVKINNSTIRYNSTK